MSKPLLTSFLIILTWMLNLPDCGNGISFAGNYQDAGALKIYGKIFDEEKKPIKGAEIEILKTNKSFQKQLTTANGKFEFKIPLNSEYVITIKLEGYLQKSIEISTAVPTESINDAHYFEFDVKMIKVTAKMDVEAMKKPVGLVFWNNEMKYFDYDKSLTIVYKKELDKKKETIKKTEESAEKITVSETKPKVDLPVTSEKKTEEKKQTTIPIQKTEKSETITPKGSATREEDIANLKKLEEEKQKKANDAKYTQNQEVEEMIKKAKEIELEQERKKSITNDNAISPKKLPEKNLFAVYADTLEKESQNKQETVLYYKAIQKEKEVSRQKQYGQAVEVEKTIESSAVIERNKKEKELAKLKESNPGLFESGFILSSPPLIKEKVIDEFFSTVYQTILIYPAKNDTFTRETSTFSGDSYYKNSRIIPQKDYQTIVEIIKLIKK